MSNTIKKPLRFKDCFEDTDCKEQQICLNKICVDEITIDKLDERMTVYNADDICNPILDKIVKNAKNFGIKNLTEVEEIRREIRGRGKIRGRPIGVLANNKKIIRLKLHQVELIKKKKATVNRERREILEKELMSVNKELNTSDFYYEPDDITLLFDIIGNLQHQYNFKIYIKKIKKSILFSAYSLYVYNSGQPYSDFRVREGDRLILTYGDYKEQDPSLYGYTLPKVPYKEEGPNSKKLVYIYFLLCLAFPGNDKDDYDDDDDTIVGVNPNGSLSFIRLLPDEENDYKDGSKDGSKDDSKDDSKDSKCSIM